MKYEVIQTKLGWKKYWGDVKDTRGLRFLIKERDNTLGRGLRKNWLGYIFNPIETALNLKHEVTLPISILIYSASPIALSPAIWVDRKTRKKNEENEQRLYENSLQAKDKVLGGDYLYNLLQDGAIDKKEFSIAVARHDFFLARWMTDPEAKSPAIQELQRLGYLNQEQAQTINAIARSILIERFEQEKQDHPGGSKMRPGWFNELPVTLYRTLDQDPRFSKLDPHSKEMALFSYYPVPKVKGSNPIELSAKLIEDGGPNATSEQKQAYQDIVKMLNEHHPLTQGNAMIFTEEVAQDPKALTKKQALMRSKLGNDANLLNLRPDFPWVEKTGFKSETAIWEEIFKHGDQEDLKAALANHSLSEEEVLFLYLKRRSDQH